MSEIKAVREGIAAKLEAAGIHVKPRFDGTLEPPIAVIMPPSKGPFIQYNTATGAHDAIFVVHLLVQPKVEDMAQEALDEYCSPEGPKSMFAILQGAVTDTHWCELMEVRNYVVKTVQDAGGIKRTFLGADFVVSVGLD